MFSNWSLGYVTMASERGNAGASVTCRNFNESVQWKELMARSIYGKGSDRELIVLMNVSYVHCTKCTVKA